MKPTRRFMYYVDDGGGDEDNPCALPGEYLWGAVSDDVLERLAEEAADDFHSCRDGWEAEWPLVIVILTEKHDEVGRASVVRESVPVFVAEALPRW